MKSPTKNKLIIISSVLIILFFNKCKEFNDDACPNCPCIQTVDPQSISDDDTIKIIGEKFNGTVEDLKLTFNGVPAKKIISIQALEYQMDTITAIPPNGIGKSIIEVKFKNLSSADPYFIDHPEKNVCNQIYLNWIPKVQLEAGIPDSAGSINGNISVALLNSPKKISIDNDNQAIYFFDTINNGTDLLRKLDHGNVSTINTSSWTVADDDYGISDAKFGQIFMRGNPPGFERIYSYDNAGVQEEYTDTSHGFIFSGSIEINKQSGLIYFMQVTTNTNPLFEDTFKICHHNPDFSEYAVDIDTMIIENPLCLHTNQIGDMEIKNGYLYLSYLRKPFGSMCGKIVRILRFSIPDFNIDTIYAHQGNDLQPWFKSLAIDNNNIVYAADEKQIYLIQNGMPSVIGGSPTAGYQNGTLLESKFDGISDIDFDVQNKLWIMDSGNKVIRSVQF